MESIIPIIRIVELTDCSSLAITSGFQYVYEYTVGKINLKLFNQNLSNLSSYCTVQCIITTVYNGYR